MKLYNWASTGMREASLEPYGPTQYVKAEDHHAAIKALRALIVAIDSARDAGCIEHLDAWDDVHLSWDVPLDNARAVLKR